MDADVARTPRRWEVALYRFVRVLILGVAKLFGRAVVRLRRRKPHHKLPYSTTIKGAPAAQVMCAARPFLGKARQLQIDRAISWQLIKRVAQTCALAGYTNLNFAVNKGALAAPGAGGAPPG